MGKIRTLFFSLSLVSTSDPLPICADLKITHTATMSLLPMASRPQPMLDGGQVAHQRSAPPQPIILCNQHEESIDHILLACPESRYSFGDCCFQPSGAQKACLSTKSPSILGCATARKASPTPNGEVSTPLLHSQRGQYGKNRITWCSTKDRILLFYSS